MSNTSDGETSSTSSTELRHPYHADESLRKPVLSRTATDRELETRDLYSSRRHTSANAGVESPARSGRSSSTYVQREASTPTQYRNDMSNETRRQNIIAMDRKRRLTGPTQDHGRRRHGFYDTQEFLNEVEIGQSSGSANSQTNFNRQRTSDSGIEVIDLTTSPLQPPNRTPAPMQTAQSQSRVYVLPRWQADSEVSECPICKRSFGFLFRRHHCRKCGRVVCNDCSPHRITIPRQFIVNSTGTIPSTPDQISNINRLTGDEADDDETSRNANELRQQHNPAIGGGEKVRLCNPCVPDPQPDPQLNYPPHNIPPSPSTHPFGDIREIQNPARHSRHNQNRRGHVESFHGASAPSNYGPLVSHYQRMRSHRPHANTLDSTTLPPFVLGGAHPIRHHSERRDRSRPLLDPFSNHHNPLDGDGQQQSSSGHGRYHSLDRPLPRPRIRSMFDEDFAPHPRLASALPPRPHPQPQLSEDDICPICRRALPPKRSDGDETAREAHIMACISSRDPSSPSSHPQSSSMPSIFSEGNISLPPPPPPQSTTHMLSFTATEKDCSSGDGNPPECSICMVEYDVGDTLARLECLCKFHRECIVSWFERKRECPVHKII